MTAANAQWSEKHVFTTGEAAKICNVSQQTVIRCFDRGELRGFRIPGSTARRIPREELIRFMQKHEISTRVLEANRFRVLIVDDDEHILAFLVELLTRDGGFEVRTAATGYEAGLLTERVRPDLILLDFHLPDVNGAVVCRTIRQNPALAGIKILVVSGVAQQAELTELLEIGADSYLRKPFDGEEVMRRIGSLLRIG
jgi:two-component system response regulator RpaA